MGATAITNAAVYCCDPAFTTIASGTVVFRDGVITAVGATADVEVPADAEVVDGKDRLAVLPGLVDVHSHSSLLKGFSENAQLMDWLPEYQREHQVLTEDDAYYACLVSYMEALKGGTTTVVDMYRFLHRGAEAASQLGIRAHLVPYAADHPTKTFFETVESNEQLIRDHHDTQDGRVKVWLGLEHITYCSAEMFERMRQLSEQYGVSIHTHTSEQKEEVDVVVELFGARPVEVFAQRGILKQGSMLAHCVWLDQNEIDILATTGTGVAHCPTSNMKLAGGAAPLPAFEAAGLNVGLGTDGAISNNSLSMWESMKMASLLQKVTRFDATAVDARQALRMATIDGARTIGIDDHVGSIEVGKQADVITVDLWQPHLLPTVHSEGHDPVLWNLVFAARASDVDNVWVQGHRRVADRRVTGVDEAAALDAIHAQTQSLLVRRESTKSVGMLATNDDPTS
jgi:5-methylthioadenosine/S-adenosylhomocysteine deaminase